MLSRIGAALLVVARVLWPFAVQGKAEKAGTIIAVVAALAFAVGSALPVLLGDGAPDPVPVEMVEPSDVLPGLDIVEPEDLGPFAQVVVGILGFGYGCSGAQQVWKDAGTQLGKCLAGLGVQGADNLVTAWMVGEAVDAAAIGWDLLPGFLDCATRFGAFVFTGLVPVTTRDSVGATMTPTARMLSALVEQGDPLALCGPRDGPPRCVIILPAP